MEADTIRSSLVGIEPAQYDADFASRFVSGLELQS